MEPGPEWFAVGKGIGEFTKGTARYEGLTESAHGVQGIH